MGASIAIFIAASSCASAPPAPQETVQQRNEREVIIGSELARQLESQLRIRREPEISAYVTELAHRLLAGAPELHESAVNVSIIRDGDARWRSYSLPGIRVYLSSSLLKNMQFENELAAVVAFELGHVRARSVIEQLRRDQAGDFPANADFFGPAGVFDYNDEQLLQALSAAIEMMYSAGYDLRGMVSLLNRFQADASISPFEGSTLSKLTDRTREIIAQHAPLRNPIVRSDRFLAIQKRMQRL